MDFRTNRQGKSYPKYKGKYYGKGKSVNYSRNPQKAEQERLLKEKRRLISLRRKQARDKAIQETNRKIRRELYILSQLTNSKVSPYKVQGYRTRSGLGEKRYVDVNHIPTLGRRQ